MIRHDNENGSVNISTSVYTDIVGTAASNCMGVKGMAARSVKDGLYHLLRKESMGKGVRVEFHEVKGTMHGFDTVFHAPTTQKMIACRIAYIKRMFMERA